MSSDVRRERVLLEIDEMVGMLHATFTPAMKRLSDLLDDEEEHIRRAAADALLDALVGLGAVALVGRRSWRR